MKKTLLAVLLSVLVLAGAFVTLNTSSVELEAAARWGAWTTIYYPGGGHMSYCDYSAPASTCVLIYQPR